MKQTTYLDSKPRYQILDGLRGVAAIMVVIFHIFESYVPYLGRQIENHGYLAVDFFFALSGFVIGYAYDDRWGKMTLGGFFKRRLIRLHPMVIAGVTIGACMFFFGEHCNFPLIAQCKGWQFALIFLLGILMIPVGPGMDIRGWTETCPMNGVIWTLQYEYVGNILYALIFRHLPKVALAVLCAVCACSTLNLALGIDIFRMFDNPPYCVAGGWSLTSAQIYVGFTRLLYPFLMGLLISRILGSRAGGSPIKLKGGFWWTSLLLVILLSMPQIGGKPGIADGLYQSVLILLMFPLILLMGSGSKTTDAFSTKVCTFLGEISYPLYITHFPWIYMQKSWIYSHADSPVWMHVLLNLGLIVMAIAIAWACLKLYDEPVRKWLTDKMFHRNNK